MAAVVITKTPSVIGYHQLKLRIVDSRFETNSHSRVPRGFKNFYSKPRAEVKTPLWSFSGGVNGKISRSEINTFSVILIRVIIFCSTYFEFSESTKIFKFL